jgi:hypothetical protein
MPSISKVLCCLSVCLMLSFVPFLVDISPDGEASAFSSRSHNRRHQVILKQETENKAKNRDSTHQDMVMVNNETANESGSNHNPSAPAPVPEPATWLLFGAGAAGLAAYRKKFRKK